MQLTVTSVDYAPDELYGQVPIVVNLLRQMPGSDRPDYWLGSVTPPLHWVVDGVGREITHLVVSARWVGGQLVTGARHLPLNIAYVATGVCDAAPSGPGARRSATAMITEIGTGTRRRLLTVW